MEGRVFDKRKTDIVKGREGKGETGRCVVGVKGRERMGSAGSTEGKGSKSLYCVRI